MSKALRQTYSIGEEVYVIALEQNAIVTDFPLIGKRHMVEVELSSGRSLLVRGFEIRKASDV